MKTLVIGLGNTILTDDGVGIYVIREVARALPADSGIDLVELSVGGVALMEEMVGYDRCILVDAMWAPDDGVGQVRVFDADQLPDTLNTASTHDADLPTALKLGRTLGAPLPEDANIQIVAIGAHDVLTFGESPTPTVAATIPEAAVQVLKLLGKEA
ncbi:MAG: hydrogenase maturation protease [Anaerolineae bacterium]|nr:hydrogenase maturation protease [Anaerolineae bacterium]